MAAVGGRGSDTPVEIAKFSPKLHPEAIRVQRGRHGGPFEGPDLTANHIYEMTLRHFWIHYLTPQRGRRGANTPPLSHYVK